jgi:hypothetical protein
MIEDMIHTCAVQLDPAQIGGKVERVLWEVKGVQDLDVRMSSESRGNFLGIVAGLLAHAEPCRHPPYLIQQVIRESPGAQYLDCLHAYSPFRLNQRQTNYNIDPDAGKGRRAGCCAPLGLPVEMWVRQLAKTGGLLYDTGQMSVALSLRVK